MNQSAGHPEGAGEHSRHGDHRQPQSQSRESGETIVILKFLNPPPCTKNLTLYQF